MVSGQAELSGLSVQRANIATLSGPGLELPPFTRNGYRRLIQRLLDAGYEPATFDTVRAACRDLIVRHDVDVSLEAAVSIAELESEMGIRASYFVMVSNSYYNIYSHDARRLIARLSELQHHIGLHFDPAVYSSGDSLGDYNAAVAHEFGLLAAIVGDPIDIISFHNPPPVLVNRERPVGGLPHTYEPRFFKDLAYVADSGGEWRYGGPFERPAFRDGTAIHLLTHPIWWDNDEPTAGPEVTLEQFVNGHRHRLEANLSRGFKAYRQLLAQRRLGR
jgi:hypothetical protein